MFEDFVDVEAVDGFVFEEGVSEGFELGFMGVDDILGADVLFFDDGFDFEVNFSGGIFGVVLGSGDFFTEEDVVLIFAVSDVSEGGHAPVADHLSSDFGGHFDVTGGAGGDIADEDIFSDTAAHGAADLVKCAFFGLVEDVFGGHEHGGA